MLRGHSLGDISQKMVKPRLLVFQTNLLPGAGIFCSIKLFFFFFLIIVLIASQIFRTLQNNTVAKLSPLPV